MVRCGVNFQSRGWSDLLKTQSVKAHDTPLVKTPQCPSILLRVRTEVVVGAPSSLYQVTMNSDEKVHPWDTCSASACAFASVLCAVPRTLSWVFSVAPTLTSCWPLHTLPSQWDNALTTGNCDSTSGAQNSPSVLCFSFVVTDRFIRLFIVYCPSLGYNVREDRNLGGLVFFLFACYILASSGTW